MHEESEESRKPLPIRSQILSQTLPKLVRNEVLGPGHRRDLAGVDGDSACNRGRVEAAWISSSTAPR